MAIIAALRRLRQEDHEFKASLGYIVRLCHYKTKSLSRGWGCSSVGEHLPSKHQVPGAIPSTVKNF
jgi:hypothetical protein